jgi:hypothetical protein
MGEYRAPSMSGQKIKIATTLFYTLKQISMKVDKWHGGKAPLKNETGTE